MFIKTKFENKGNKKEDKKIAKKIGMNIDSLEFLKGQITVYLALMLILILSLVCTTIESVRVEGAKLMIQNIMQMGVESIFAEYNKALLEEYDLFFVDTAYGTDSEYAMDSRMYDYIEKNYNIGTNLSSLNGASVYRISCEDLSIDKKVLATDDKGGPYYAQAVDYMKSQIGVNTLLEFFNTYSNDVKLKMSEFQETENQKDDKLSGLSEAKSEYQEEYDLRVEEAEENNEDVDMEEPSTESNPLDEISRYMTMGILELILGSDVSISDKQITLVELPSHRELKRGNGSYKEETSVTSKVIFVEYLKEKFKSVIDYEENPEEETTLDYQLEYIYAGKKSDSKNLEAVLSKMLLMREGINLAYLVTDTAKVAKAEALAIALVGYLGIPAFVEGMKYALLAGWAFVESVVEIRGLVDGKKVAMIKNSDNWNVDFSEIATFNDIELDEVTSGVDYLDCLRLLFYMEDAEQFTIRSLDIIELEIQRKTGNNNFFVDNCMMKCRACGNWHIDNVFLNMGYRILATNGGYDASTSVEYTYMKEY